MRRPVSELHPWLHAVRAAELRLERRASDRVRRVRFARVVATRPLPFPAVRHASLLRRRLQGVDPGLQESKIRNLQLAAAAIDGLLIRPGETFSFWDRVGPPTSTRGYVDGLILRRGRITRGVGGGLCQLSNLIYWMALHTPLEVVEHHHHGFDPFPDVGRVLPFGSGATIFYNYGDLRLANPTDQPFRLSIRLGPRRLHGCITTDRPWPMTYHIEEHSPRFTRGVDGAVYRDNELWRRVVDRMTGATIERRCIARNHARVAYPVAEDRLEPVPVPGPATAAGASLAGDGGVRAR